jgi:hypothetical protein
MSASAPPSACHPYPTTAGLLSWWEGRGRTDQTPPAVLLPSGTTCSGTASPLPAIATPGLVPAH